MSKVNQNPAASAVAQPVMPTIGGKPAIELQDTIFSLGRETVDAEALMSKGESARDSLDAALFDFVSDLPYVEYVVVRDFYKSGIVDLGKTEAAADQVWVRAINRIRRTFDFVPPKAESKDAERMAKKRAEAIAKLEAFSDEELEEHKEALLGKGDNKSLAEARKINSELERRNKTEIDAAKANRKAMVDKIRQRVGELAKAGTADADELLTQVLLMLG
jgi:hypothetical protein